MRVLRLGIGLVMLWAWGALGGALAEEGAGGRGADAADAELAALVFDAQRFGNTPAKKEARARAREALFAMGPPALDYLMTQASIENGGIQLLIHELIQDHVPAAAGGPVLKRYLASPVAEVRRLAAYYLGTYDLPEEAPLVLPLLDDEKVAGAAMRTLGKWGCVEAVPRLIVFTRDAKERRRILAVNALGDIGDPAAIPALRAALEDPIFTVRRAAERALDRMAVGAEAALPAAQRD